MNLRTLTLAVLACTALPIAASAQNYNHHNESRAGVIASVQGSSFTLRNGTTVFMHRGTVINPTGAGLQPGMRVSVTGNWDGHSRINASEVDVNGATAYRNGSAYPRYYQNGWRDRNGNMHPY